MTQAYNMILSCGHECVMQCDELTDDYDMAHDTALEVPCIYCGTPQLVTFRVPCILAAEGLTKFTIIPQ